MEMHYTYGIYEGEIDPVLTAVRSHSPLPAIEAMPCPCCGARISVAFSPEGHDFIIGCSGKPVHFSKNQEIATPPPWWKDRVEEVGPVTYYWLDWSSLSDDGTLEMKVTGYGDDSHWTGAMAVRPDETDYPLWRWIIGQGDRYNSLINDKDLKAIREEYHRIADQGHCT